VALQTGVTGMQVSTWVNGAWRQGGADPGANAAGTAESQGQLLQQQAQQQANPNAQAINEPIGMQVALQAQGLQAPMIKSFLLGEP
jgi:general secretion pathway protein J